VGVVSVHSLASLLFCVVSVHSLALCGILSLCLVWCAVSVHSLCFVWCVVSVHSLLLSLA
jgi:hypothetical protein